MAQYNSQMKEDQLENLKKSYNFVLLFNNYVIPLY
jgi:hypothetical protein